MSSRRPLGRQSNPDSGSPVSGFRPGIPILLAMTAGILFLLWPLFTRDWWPDTHEGNRYQVLLQFHLDAFREGHWFPRWLPDMTGGYGYPLFVFYQPGFFLLALPVALVTGNAALSVPIVVALLFATGGTGAFVLGRLLAGPNGGALAAGVFLLTPYHFVNLYVRGDLSELMAALLTPWPLVGLLLLEQATGRGRSCLKGSLVLGIGLACIVVSHPITAFFLFPVLACIAVFLISAHAAATRSALVVEILTAFAFGLAASSFYWVHVLQMLPCASLSEVGTTTSFFGVHRHTVEFHQFFSRAWGYGLSAPDSANDSMSFQLGLPHFLLALSGLAMGKKNRQTLFFGALYLLLILLMSPLAVWFWRIPFLKSIQFPWRILSVTAVIQMVCVLGWFDRTAYRPKWSTPALGWIAGVLVLPCLFFWQPKIRRVETMITVHPAVLQSVGDRCRQTAGCRVSENDRRADPWRFLKLITRTPAQMKTNPPDLAEISASALALARASPRRFYNLDRGEWLPKTARPELLPGPRHELLFLSVDGHLTADAGNSPYFISCRITPEASPAEVIVNQFYFPGWRVRLNGMEMPDERLRNQLTPDGRIRVIIPSTESYHLEAWYDGPPHWRMRSVLVALILCAFALFRMRMHRRR